MTINGFNIKKYRARVKDRSANKKFSKKLLGNFVPIDFTVL